MCTGWGLFRRGDEFKGPQWAGCQKVGPQGGGLGWRGGFRRPRGRIEAMGGEEIEHREKEKRPLIAVRTVILRAKRRERRRSSTRGVTVARDVGCKRESTTSPCAQMPRAAASLPRLALC